MRLFFAKGCPFAHRTRALLTLVEHPFEPREIDLANKPADFLALSPTGAVPLLDDDGFVMYESAVINEYLAEALKWREAFSPNVQIRARERLAMKRFDDVIVMSAFASFKDPATAEAKPQWKKEVEQLAVTAGRSSVQSLLGLHVATHWLRWQWAFADSPVVLELGKALGPFLEAAAKLPCVVATSPDREETTQMMRKRFGPAQ